MSVRPSPERKRRMSPTVHPIIGMMVGVRERDDKDSSAMNLVNDAIGKSSQDCEPMLIVITPKHLWSGDNQFE